MMGYVGIALQTAYYELLNGSSFEQSLVDIMKRGGDTDTIGCIAGRFLTECPFLFCNNALYIPKVNKKFTFTYTYCYTYLLTLFFFACILQDKPQEK